MPRRILIVEADARRAEELFVFFHREARSLEGERYEADIATCVAQAIEKGHSTIFDCVIMDVNLPEMHGYEAVRLMRSIGSDLPIILVGADNTAELEAKVREQNVYYYHLTSFDGKELSQAVESVFEKLSRAAKSKADMGAGGRISLKPLRLFAQRDKHN
ncbi:MAG TPA: response regulator [Sedimentisphaerales bacterium]|nr:response regulator [Sedimentisphaerales bacterium]